MAPGAILCAWPHGVGARGGPIDLIESSRFDWAWICRACELLFERARATGARVEAVLQRPSELGRSCSHCTHAWRERHALPVRRWDMDPNRPDRERPG